jgi:hypothetical protein
MCGRLKCAGGCTLNSAAMISALRPSLERMFARSTCLMGVWGRQGHCCYELQVLAGGIASLVGHSTQRRLMPIW